MNLQLAVNDEKAPLQNNVIVNTIKNKINKIITGPIIGFDTSDKYLAEIGVSTNQDGTLTLNEQTFNSKFEENTLCSMQFNSMFSSVLYLKLDLQLQLHLQNRILYM